VGSHGIAIPCAIGDTGPAAGEIGTGFRPPPLKEYRGILGWNRAVMVLCEISEFLRRQVFVRVWP
jgi:hypothetical protein